jgi:hypothetical protein
VLLLFLVFYSDVFRTTQSQISQGAMAEKEAKGGEAEGVTGGVVGGIREKGPGIPEEMEKTAPAESPPRAQQAEKRKARMTARMEEPAKSQEAKPTLKFYPEIYPDLPISMSPCVNENNQEILITFHESGLSLIPVTVGIWEPFDSYYGKFIKGDQLGVDSEDFPALEESGLHSEEDLKKVKSITGKTIHEINKTAKSEQSSYAGFISVEEDIMTVIRRDNELVRELELTHPDMARPLFHVWNALLFILEKDGVTGEWRPFESIQYKGNIVFVKTQLTRGFQESIFNDEIRGSFLIKIWRELKPDEKDFLQKAYSHLSQDEFDEMTLKLTHMTIGEMNPYYIMRYGFYEGYTFFRADPIAIALIFGLKSLEEIEATFQRDLSEILIEPFSRERRPGHDSCSPNKTRSSP